MEQIGSPDITARITTNVNVTGISQNEVVTSLVTRLIPYGKNDMPITSYPESGVHDYIDSPHIAEYGKREKYVYWGNIDDLEMLYKRTEWQFDPNNPERWDKPQLTITGRVVDLFKQNAAIPKIALGDAVQVIDKSLDIDQTERVISEKRYPYNNTNSELTIGHILRDMFFYVKKANKAIGNISNMINNYNPPNPGGGEGGGTTIANAVIIDHFAATMHITDVQIDREIEYYVGNFTTVPDKALLQYNFGVSPPVFYAQGNGLTFQSGDSYELFGLTYILQEYNQIEMENGDKIDLKMELVSLTSSRTTFMITSTRNGGVVGTYSLTVTSSPEDPIVNFGMSLGQNIGGGYRVSGINSALVGASGVPVIILGSVEGSTSVTYPILPITIYIISQSGTVAKSAPRCGQWINGNVTGSTNIKMSSDEYINALQIQSITVTSGWQTTATFSQGG
ncbi:hypothetical protein FACS1894188_11390 [Clostridia bacterium]|nr:hypothetical protein FACS1894188_11390 [Clostridia bacterium]